MKSPATATRLACCAAVSPRSKGNSVSMSRSVGRHRAARPSSVQLLRRPAVITSAAIATVSISATAYASTGAVGASSAASLKATAPQAAPAIADSTADAAAKAALMKRVASARTAVTSRSVAQRAGLAATAKANRAAAVRSATSVGAAKKAAAVKRADLVSKVAMAKKAATTRKAAVAKNAAAKKAAASSTPVTSGSPQAIAASMLSSYGWGQDQMGCLSNLWTKESGWTVNAQNRSSSAYGIPQALPGSKMASAGATGVRTPPPRSSGVWVTSRVATGRHVVPGRTRSPSIGTESAPG